MITPVKEISSTGPSSVNFLKREGLCTAQEIAALNIEDFELLIQNETHQLRHALRIVKLNAEQIVPMLVSEAVAVPIEYIRCVKASVTSTLLKEEVVVKVYKGNKY